MGIANINQSVDYSGLGLTGLTLDPVDEAVMAMGRDQLVHYIDPARFTPGGAKSGLSRGDKGVVSWTKSNLSVLASDSDFNDKSVFNFATADTDLLLPIGTPTESVTFVACCQLTSARRSGSTASYLFTRFHPTLNYEETLQWAANAAPKVLAWSPESQTGGNGVNVADASFLAGDEVGLVAVSFDHATLTSEVYVRDFTTPVVTKTSSQGPRTDPGARWCIGIQFSTTLGWVGKIGRILIFRKAYHLNRPDRARLADLQSALDDFYDL